ncbi:phosphoenolpyruvate--protein phosphotransferase [Methylobrevis albus]|uniref:Phosphoenolpyruvate-protein phosphotransferase n=1 Tax=Methylobrevis albus TaxID=2793297 RepID=A0A931MYW1_9HYPH|nr:phosphoenolpyruvate--protein phosphotransferase [Methylobrevis albus]MBH0238867.1 phosphoenolpyruvate--protein phosphotransferase [Methylobrevis albus]
MNARGSAPTTSAALVLAGRSAAPGLAAGRIARIAGPKVAARAPSAAGDPAAEAARLAAAVAAALAALEALAAAAEGDAADILAFQVAMLADDALTEGAFAAVASGAPAETGWSAALDAEIEGYAAADDEYFRARAADLADIRDRVLSRLSGAEDAPPPAGAILVGDDLTPSKFLAADWSAGGGIVLAAGSPASHVAMLARARGVPMVVGVGDVGAAADGAEALLDGDAGTLTLSPGDAEQAAFHARRDAAAVAGAAAETLRFRPAVTADGEPVRVHVNLADPEELAGLDPAQCDGVGLVRTEFLFHAGRGLPDEAAQLAVYRRILAWAAGRPVTFRTLDAGGDKPIPGLTIDGESNPFLGLRGLRLSLAYPDVFRTQLRALCRAAVDGHARVMLPMVTVPAELAAAAVMLDSVVADLAAENLPHRRPPLGIMVEVPAAALAAESFAADFYSIGSNDLTQYTMAAARDVGAVAHLCDAGSPAVLRLVAATVEAAAARGVEVSLCGDAAADPALVPLLLGAGLRSLSVAPVAVARTKAAIAGFSRHPPP